MLTKAMGNLTNAYKALKENVRTVVQSQRRLAEYTTDHLKELYATMEVTRCQYASRISNVEKQMSLLMYKRYLAETLEAVVETATSGKITPRVLPVPRLHQILREKRGVKGLLNLFGALPGL